MKATSLIPLLLLSLPIGYINCWYNAKELNVCDVSVATPKIVHQKVQTYHQDGYLGYQWLPRRHELIHKKRVCCPGWGSYVKNYGCWEKLKCQVSLPQKASLECKMDRNKQLEAEKLFYKFKETKSLNDPSIADGELILPTLDQPLNTIFSKYSLDEIEGHWFNTYFTYFGVEIGKMLAEAYSQFPVEQLSSYSEFMDVVSFYTDRIKGISNDKIYLFGSDPSKVLDVFKNDKWMEDKYFTMKRLVYYPNSIRRVNAEDGLGINYFTLKAQLNPIFDWDSAVKEITGMNFYMSVIYGLVYVIDHSIMNGIPHDADFTDRDPTDTRTLREPVVPIAIFAIEKNAAGVGELKIVAIQKNKETTSQVLTPKDGDRWMIMKMQFEATDTVIHEIGLHLTEHHFSMERICISMHRQFSTLHPLRQILERHCIGTLAVNNNALQSILGDGGTAQILFGVSNNGSIKLSNRVFENMKWKDLDFLERMKLSGTMDHQLFPYHPFRDDGALLYGVMKEMANDYVDVYYKTDSDVAGDTELQSYANELSLQGTSGPEAGKGKLDGFPNGVLTKKSLKQIITQILWIIVEHNQVGFSSADFSTFLPSAPTKLYTDSIAELTPLKSLGDSHLAVFQARTVFIQTALHYDVLFDYGKFIVDKMGRDVVDRYHTKLMTIIKPIIEKRNIDRLAQEQFSYPYFLPGFITNAVAV